MNKLTLRLLAILVVAAILPARPVLAQSILTPAQKDQMILELRSEIRKLEQRVDTLEGLDQRVKVIDQKVEVQQQAEVVRQKTAPVIKAGADGFSISSADKDYSFKLGALIQGDGRFFTSGSDKTATGSTFFSNRARPIFTGTVAKYYDFNLTPDFGQGRVTLQDAFINVTYYKEAQLLSGKFKAPFDLERLQSDRDLPFSERALTTNLAPNRDIGTELHSDLFDNRLTYQLALMNGVPDNTASADNDFNDGKDFLGRLFVQPFRQTESKWIKGLGIGFAGTYGHERNGTTSTYRTFGQSTWFSYNKGVSASGERYRIAPQAYYYAGPLGLMAEYNSDTHALNRSVVVTKGGVSNFVNDTETFGDDGYMAVASYVLTGENASYTRVKPNHPFDPRHGTFGAFELAARISNVATDSGQFKLNFVSPSVSARTATEYAFGVNWYLNNMLKLQLAYARTFFDKGGPGGSDRPDESVFETQLQLAF